MARPPLVKWPRHARTKPLQWLYNHVKHIIRICNRLLCGDYSVPLWALCPIHFAGVPDFGLTPLADTAWPHLAFGRAVPGFWAGLPFGDVGCDGWVLLAMPCPCVVGVVLPAGACAAGCWLRGGGEVPVI
jgi:hypothetical protein